jgi:hypothetical protein
MKRRLLCLLIAFVATVGSMAQIPANVREVLKKCDEKMDNPAGLVVDLTMKAKVMAVISLNGTAKMYSKGDKEFMTMTMKAFGQEFREESGFDGQQSWDFTAAESKKERDTLVITKTTKAQKSELSLNMDYDKEYKSAKMREKGLYYEIEFFDRVNPEMPKKMTVKIAKDSYYLREFTAVMGMGKVTMTVTKVTVGEKDSMFKLDMNRYKNAVVVRR